MVGQSDPRTLLAHLIQADDRTRDQICADFERTARTLGLSATMTSRHLRRLANGERSDVSRETRRVMQAMWERPVGELLSAWPGETRPASGLVVPSPGDHDREMINMAMQRARRFTLSTGQTELTSDVMAQLHDDVAHLAQAYPQRPLADLLGDLVATQDSLYTILEQRRSPAQARDLYFLAAVTGGMLAKASHDMADPHASLTQARTAFMCAEQADHDGLRAWIRGLQSLVAYWAGRTRESVSYAQSGSEFAARSGSTTAVWLPISEARAWAALGNASATHSAIQRAERAWDSVAHDDLDELGGLCTFSRSRQIYYSADALAWLPSEAQFAQDYGQQAVDAYVDPSHPDWAFGDQAGSHADLAIARIAGGDVEGATEAVAPVLDLDPERRINGIVHSAQRVHHALRVSSADNSAAVDLQERLEMFTRTPLKSLPR